MTLDFFAGQSDRLVRRFGSKAFDQEFTQLVWREVHDMSEHAFMQFVDVMIGSRSHNKPPLLSDFREARIKENKRKFENDVNGAARLMFGDGTPGAMRSHLKALLNKEYGGGVDTPKQAVEVARLRLIRNDKGPA